MSLQDVTRSRVVAGRTSSPVASPTRSNRHSGVRAVARRTGLHRLSIHENGARRLHPRGWNHPFSSRPPHSLGGLVEHLDVIPPGVDASRDPASTVHQSGGPRQLGDSRFGREESVGAASRGSVAAIYIDVPLGGTGTLVVALVSEVSRGVGEFCDSLDLTIERFDDVHAASRAGPLLRITAPPAPRQVGHDTTIKYCLSAPGRTSKIATRSARHRSSSSGFAGKARSSLSVGVSRIIPRRRQISAMDN